MYCSECGQQARGKFCCHCGAALAAEAAAPFDWRHSCDFDRIRQTPDVSRRVEQAKATARTKVPASQLLGLIDAAATPFTGGLSSMAIAKIAQPLASRMGLNSEKDRRECVALPPGVVLGNLAVRLASIEHTITSVVHGEHGCQVQATLPADLRAMESRLTIEVCRTETGDTQVAASVLIEGQWYDWGKCQSGLDQLFAGLRAA